MDSKHHDASKPGEEAYLVTFKVHYPTKFGEHIQVIGSTPELGEWERPLLELTWTEGHVWTNPEPLLVSSAKFFYKYVLTDENDPEALAWERGIDRIAELKQLPFSKDDGKEVKQVELHDSWEELKVRFTVFDPFAGPSDKISVLVGGAFSLEGGQDREIALERSKARVWLDHKYGKTIQPWEGVVPIPNTSGDSNGQIKPGEAFEAPYTYLKHLSDGGEIRERLPPRRFFFETPSAYKSSSTGHAVNGVANMEDGTFLNGFFFNEIGDTAKSFNFILGSYPLFEVDVEKIVEHAKVSAVLNLMTEAEMKDRGISLQTQKQFFAKHGISVYEHVPLDDNSPEEYQDSLFQAALALEQLISKEGRRVYIHCLSGVTRGPTLATLYLSLLMKTNDWREPYKVETLVRDAHFQCHPNMKAVQATLSKFAWYRDQLIEEQRQIEIEKERLRRAREAERQRLEKIAIQEHDLLWRRREAYLNKERLELKRKQDEERERQRRIEAALQKKRDLEEEERQRLISMSHEQEEQLLEHLKTVEESEAERKRRLQEREKKNQVYEHFIEGQLDFNGISESEIDEQCTQLFKTAPIKFVPRKGDKVDEEVVDLIEDLDITVPIIWVKQSIYLVGSQKISLEKKGEYVTAQVGGGYEKFSFYIQKNHKAHERALILKMIQSRQSLEWIVDALITGQRIPNLQGYNNYSGNEVLNFEEPVKLQVTKRLSMSSSSRKDISASPTRRSQTKRSTFSGVSPTRGSSSPFKKALTSPMKKTQKHSLNPNTAETLYQGQESAYVQQKSQLMKQLKQLEDEREEHISRGDQRQKANNEGVYHYVHHQQ